MKYDIVFPDKAAEKKATKTIVLKEFQDESLKTTNIISESPLYGWS